MILIYTQRITKRVSYIFKLYFEHLIGIPYELTSNGEAFDAYEGPKLNYSTRQFKDSVQFHPAELLFKTGIEGQELNVFTHNGLKAFYPVHQQKAVLPFDPFAAAFYLVTRYEEYLPYRKDKFGRFDAFESISVKYDFLQKPLVNIWSQQIKQLFLEKYPDLKFKKRYFRFIPTYDIDSAYAYRCKGTVRTVAATIRDMLKFDFYEIYERAKVIFGRQPDPFDTYDFQLALQKEFSLHPVYFVLMADYGQFDKNLPVGNTHFQHLIKSLADYGDVGVHPSFEANTSFQRLSAEVSRLSSILNREITRSRQHFLRVNFPITYRNLIQADITNDYTMGYASLPGFRAGICDTYNFYDLDLETETMLRIHPFAVMDGTLRDYMLKEIPDSLQIIKQLIDEVKAVNGTFISLWHNESLCNQKRWEGWQALYVDLIRYAMG
ncbi:MAG: hypothetical protein EOM06_08775 [Sphingobacteriia bacterium]|nr:hypothetical protein [Sphingobacteriia bacterium]